MGLAAHPTRGVAAGLAAPAAGPLPWAMPRAAVVAPPSSGSLHGDPLPGTAADLQAADVLVGEEHGEGTRVQCAESPSVRSGCRVARHPASPNGRWRCAGLVQHLHQQLAQLMNSTRISSSHSSRTAPACRPWPPRLETCHLHQASRPAACMEGRGGEGEMGERDKKETEERSRVWWKTKREK